MSTLAEQVDVEQAEYEAEGEGEPEPEPDPEPGPDEPEPAEPEALVAIGPDEIAKAERARSAYRKKIGDILGAESVEHECLLCAGLGYLPALPPPGVTFTIVDTDEGPALLADEPRSEPPYKVSEVTETCAACDGYGLVLTGAKTEGGRLWQCSVCGGAGHVPKAGANPPLHAVAPTAAPSPPSADITMGGSVPDAWGRPSGHQHWGVPPAAIPG
jgi:hypothetical protein